MPKKKKPPVEPNAPQGEFGVSASSARLQEFLFTRELSEVYLLLDNVSTSADKSLPAPTDSKGKNAKPDLIAQVCAITWPTHGPKTEQAQRAAILMRAKDKLNALAAPATGMTIAFTLLVAGEDAGASRRPSYTYEGGEPLSRVSLANQAFPNLVRSANLFAWFIRILIGAVFVWLLLTAALSWNVATGNAVLSQWGKLRQDQSDIIKQIDEAKKSSGPAAPGQAQPTPTTIPTPVALSAEEVALTQEAAQIYPGGVDAAGTCRQLCLRLVESHRELCSASANLNNWLQAWWRFKYPERTGFSLNCSGAANLVVVNDQWASTLLNILGGAVLPIFYGVLGAGAAVVRKNSARIRDSLLSPRHLMLAWIQLALGAVIGGCVGLFVTTTTGSSMSGSATPGLLGAVPLSASALCFIAGFGVDGVFLALEGLIGRVFNIADVSKTPASKPDQPAAVVR